MVSGDVSAAGGSLDPAGPVAGEMAELWWILLALGVAVFAVFAFVLTTGLVRTRTGRTLAERPAIRGIVAGGVVMPAVVLVVVLGFTIGAMRTTPATAPPEALVVEIVGHQWWWDVRYPQHGVRTANEMHLPVGRPVELRLISADVIHSFWVPQLAGKLDLLPERENSLVVEADEPGEYRGQCAEFCGLQHAKMRFLAVAEPPERFAAWLARQQRPSTPPALPILERGRQLFLDSGCGSCHTVRGTPATAEKGPDLTHVSSRETLAAGTLPNTRRHLAEWLSDPQRIKQGTQMEAPQVRGEDMEALVAYVESLE